VMSATPAGRLESIPTVLALDIEAREAAQEMVRQRSRSDLPVRAIP